MPRTPKGYFDPRRKVWLCRLGERSEINGKLKPVVLCHEDGRPVAKGDQRGRLQAIDRLLSHREERHWCGQTVREVCAGFLAWMRAEGKADRTIADYDYHLRRWGGRVGYDRAASSITPDDLWSWEDSGLGCYRQTVQAVKAAFGWASRPIRGRVPTRILDVNPFTRFPVPASEPTERALPWEDARRVLRLGWAFARMKANARMKQTKASRRLRWLCLAVIAWTGLRPAECWGMRWEEWNPEAGLFLPDPGRIKTRRFRPAPLPPKLVAIVEGMRRIADAEYCFRDRASKATAAPDVNELIRWVREGLKPYLEAHGCRTDWTLYSLRHGWFSDAIGLAGISADAAALAGANSPEVIRARYLSVQGEVVRKTSEKLWKGRRKRG